MQVAEIGHNKPPSDAEILSQQMWEKHKELLDEAVELSKLQPVAVEDDDADAKVSDTIKKVKGIQRKVEDIRKAEKDFYFRKGQTIDTFFNDFKGVLEATIGLIQKPLTEYKIKKDDEERARLAKESERLRKEAEEQAALAALQEKAKLVETADKTLEGAVELQVQAAETAREAVNAKSNDLTRVSGLTSTSSLSTKWEGQITDVSKIDLEKLRPYIKLADLQTALNAFVRAGGRECAGAEIYQSRKTAIR